MEHKIFSFKSVGVDERGVFQGRLGVYRNVDLQGDILEPGSATKSIRENPRIPMLWSHDPSKPVGVINLTDSPDALLAAGKLNLDVQGGAEAYNILKFNQSVGLKSGLSIGYLPVPGKTRVENGIRRLMEVRIFEGSIVTTAANPLAQVDSVKSLDGTTELGELDEMLKNYQRQMDAVLGRPQTIDAMLADFKWRMHQVLAR